jgi:hypothetical protein
VRILVPFRPATCHRHRCALLLAQLLLLLPLSGQHSLHSPPRPLLLTSAHTPLAPTPHPPHPHPLLQALDRATQALPPRKHVKVLAAAALLHFRQGSPERARTMFEALLRNHPKRLDLWGQYIDQVRAAAALASASQHQPCAAEQPPLSQRW